MKVFNCPDRPGVCKLVSNAGNWRYVGLDLFALDGQNLPSSEEALKIWKRIDFAGFDNPVNGDKVFDGQYFAEADRRRDEEAEAQRVREILRAAKIADAIGGLAGHHGGAFVLGEFDFEMRGGKSIAIKSFGTDMATALAIIALLRARGVSAE